MERGMSLRLEKWIMLCILVGLPVSASAHPLVDEAIEAYEEADFESALEAFQEAASNADLSVEELLQLFEMRALVHHALQDEEAMRQDLQRLIAVRPSYRLGRLAPPPVREAFDELVEQSRNSQVELRIEERDLDGSRTVLARVLRVPADLVDHVTLECDVGPEGKKMTRSAKGTRAELALPGPGAHRGCSASARTRQGGVLFYASLQPSIPTAATADIFRTPQYQGRADETASEKRKKWPWFVAAAAVAAAGGLAAGLVLAKPSSSQPELGGVTVKNW